jgi:hypothetical protein
VRVVPCLGDVVVDTTVVFRNVCHELRHGKTPHLIALARVGSIQLVTAPHVPVEARDLLPKIARTAGSTVEAAEAVLSEHISVLEVRHPSRPASALVDRVTACDASDAPLAAVLVESPTAWLLSDDGVFARAGARSASERQLLELLAAASVVDAGLAGALFSLTLSCNAVRDHPRLAMAAILAVGILALRDPVRAKRALRQIGRGAASALADRASAVQQAESLRALV